MNIPTYQIHNILKAFSKQFGRSKKPKIYKMSISDEKRQTIIDKTASDIVARIVGFEFKDEINDNIFYQRKDASGKNFESTKQKESGFIFNSIDKDNKKTRCAISLEDSKYLIRRLSHLSEEGFRYK